MKRWILLSALVFTSPVFANKSTNDGVFAFAEVLMYQIREANAANWGQILHPSSANETIQFLGVPFKWSPGFRIGLGYNGKAKPWNILFYYTGYKTQGTNQASTDTGEIHSAFSSNFYANNPQGNGITGPFYHQAAMQWNVAFNSFDIELGRQIKVDKLVDMRPFLGLKAAMINQSINTTWLNPYPEKGALIPNFTFATENITNNFKGIGPTVGLDSALHLYTAPTHALNLIGNISGALLYSTWRFVDIYQNNAPQTIATMNDSLSAATTMARAYLGIEYSSVINNTNWLVRLGYEGQVWFNQLQYYSFDMGKTNDPLYFQGAVLSLGIQL